jgi:hypothetical protein
MGRNNSPEAQSRRARRAQAGRARDVGREDEAINDATNEAGAMTRRGVDRSRRAEGAGRISKAGRTSRVGRRDGQGG